MIKEYFANYCLHTVGRHVRPGDRLHRRPLDRRREPWRSRSSTPASDTMTGGRLLRVARLSSATTFCLTYGDGVTDVDITRAASTSTARTVRGDGHRRAAARAASARSTIDGRRRRRSFKEKPDGRRRLDQRRLLRAGALDVSTTSTATPPSGSRAPGAARAPTASSPPTATTASGSRWTRCATRPTSRALWASGTPRLEGVVSATGTQTAGSAGTPLEDMRRRPRRVAARQLVPDRGRRCSTGTRSTIRCTPTSAPSCRLVQLPDYETPRGDLRRLRLLLVVLGELARPRRRLRATMIDRAFRDRLRLDRSSRSPATTATCCGTSSRRACRCSASSPRPTSPRSRAATGVPTTVQFFGAETATAPGGRGATPPTCHGGEQRLRARARPQRLRRGLRDAAGARGRRDARVPAPRPPDRSTPSSTPSTTSTSRYFSLRDRRARLRRARAAGLRRRGAADPRRFPAPVRAATRGPPTARPTGSRSVPLSRRETAAGLDDDGHVPGVRASGSSTSKQRPAGVPRCRPAAQGRSVAGVRGAGQGQHAPQLLRRRPRPDRLHRRPQARTSRAPTSPGAASRSSRPSRSSRRSPTTC